MNQRETLKINNNFNLEIGGIEVASLAKKYGTPLYVLDQKYVEDMCDIYSSALTKYYGEGMISYASKAFSCKEIYRIVKKQGIGTDVVSIGELYTALKGGFDPKKITFHGNNKSFSELEYAVKNGVGHIVIDSFTETDDIDLICKNLNKKQEVLIRVNPGVEAHTHHFIQTSKIDSKFGFSIESGEALEIVKYVLSKSNLILKGLHCHIGSQIFEEKSFILAVEKMTDFYLEIKNTLNYEFDAINLGGGFGIWYADGDSEKSVEAYAEYIKVISDALNRCVNEKGIKKPYLMLEPGRSIVGEAGITIYTAGRIREIKDVKNFIAIDGGMFENPRFALYQAKYTVVAPTKMNESATKKYTIAGKCCESGDIIAEDVMLPNIVEGDLLAVLSTGAYNYSMASNYNRNFIPLVVSVKDGKSKIIVKKQTLKDLVRNDV